MGWEAVLVVQVNRDTHTGLWAILQASSFSKEVYASDDGAYRIAVPAKNAGYAHLYGVLEDAFKPEAEPKTSDTRILARRTREAMRATERWKRVVSYKGIETTLPRNPEPLLEQLRKTHLLTFSAQSAGKSRLIVVPPLKHFGDAADIIGSFTKGPGLRRV